MGADRTGRPGPTDQGTGQAPGRRLTVPEAASALGISADAVRSRIKRGTLRAEREGGRVFIVLGSPDRAQPTNRPGATDQPTDDLREQVRYLREQLRREQEAHAEARRIIAGLVQRVPAIEAPTGSPSPGSDAPGPPSGGEDTPQRGETPGGQDRPADRPWWRRVFGG